MTKRAPTACAFCSQYLVAFHREEGAEDAPLATRPTSALPAPGSKLVTLAAPAPPSGDKPAPAQAPYASVPADLASFWSRFVRSVRRARVADVAVMLDVEQQRAQEDKRASFMDQHDFSFLLPQDAEREGVVRALAAGATGTGVAVPECRPVAQRVCIACSSARRR